MATPTTSGTWNWQPNVATFIRIAYSRIQIYAPALETNHIIDAREVCNLILTDFGNRGLNLWSIDQVTIPLQPNVTTYTLPINTVDILDTYLRQYTPGSVTTLGNSLTVMTTADGDPMLQATGEPMVLAPGSGVFSITEGSQIVTMNWPSNGLVAGAALTFATPVTIGPMTLYGTITVSTIIDQNNFQFLLPSPATTTEDGTGGTPLFVTKAGSSTVTVVLAGHGLSVGSAFDVQITTSVGGLSLSGSYTVTGLPDPAYDFTIQAASAATSNDVAFENGGQIGVATQQNSGFVDTLLWPISRNDYAALPTKYSTGRPSIYWFDRIVPPTLTFWPAPPVGSNYGVVSYRLRDVMDANPTMGQLLDMPKRGYAAFCDELCARLSEIYRPERFQEKAAIALASWDRFAAADREKLSSFVVPQLHSYYR